MKEILRDVKALAVEYHETTGEPLGAIGEIAEFEASQKLGLNWQRREALDGTQFVPET